MEATGKDELCSNSDNNNNNPHNSDKNIVNLMNLREGHTDETSKNIDTSIDYIDLLPDEILEFILSYLPPYKDLETCCLVSKRWCNITKSNYIYIYH